MCYEYLSSVVVVLETLIPNHLVFWRERFGVELEGYVARGVRCPGVSLLHSSAALRSWTKSASWAVSPAYQGLSALGGGLLRGAVRTHCRWKGVEESRWVDPKGSGSVVG